MFQPKGNKNKWVNLWNMNHNNAQIYHIWIVDGISIEFLKQKSAFENQI